MKRASKSKFPFAIILLLIFQMANADVTYEEGQNRLLFGDIEGAIEIFENLALFGDSRAADAAEQLRTLSVKEREQYVSQIAAGALESGNLDEAERLFSLLRDQATERDDQESVDVYDEVLTLVADAREQVAAAQELSAAMKCQTTMTIQGGSIETNAEENCPADAPASLIQKHSDEVAAARQALRESGATEGSILIITDDQNPALPSER